MCHFQAQDRHLDGENFVLIDVRGPEEVAATGKLLPDAITVPLPEIFADALAMDEEDFEERYYKKATAHNFSAVSFISDGECFPLTDMAR